MTTVRLRFLLPVGLLLSLQLGAMFFVARRQVETHENLQATMKSVAKQIDGTPIETDASYGLVPTISGDSFMLTARPYIDKRRKHFNLDRFRVSATSISISKHRTISMREACPSEVLLGAIESAWQSLAEEAEV